MKSIPELGRRDNIIIYSGIVDIGLAMFLSALDGATWVFLIEVCFCWGCFSWRYFWTHHQKADCCLNISMRPVGYIL